MQGWEGRTVELTMVGISRGVGTGGGVEGTGTHQEHRLRSTKGGGEEEAQPDAPCKAAPGG